MAAPQLCLAALAVLALLHVVCPQSCPTDPGTPGLPGIPGLPGRDGRDGEKGEKGAPGDPTPPGQMGQKGQKGELGGAGMLGKMGRSGTKGARGLAGLRGPPGDMGESGFYELALQSAFSVSRRTVDHPAKNTPVRFTTVITNINGHYNTDVGKFRCHIPGSYYFVYHASSDAHLCLTLVKDEEKVASFCDHITSDYQTSSAGLALRLEKDQEVWLETNDYNGMIGTVGKQSVFSGFLLYPD
ncbi:complement C1q subcomponent subunit C [Amia ocellicauda]|uniref:complement C1q subcomponent subunit C n=1 Tax=Amia ocellicauda TaxID=2972642 RepID=UPI003463D484|nr:C1QC protein [Amia calva]